VGGGLLDLALPRRGHFAFGPHHGDLWLDLDALVAEPAALRPHTDRLARRLAPYEPEVICGPLTGGAFVAQLVALALEVAFTWSTPWEIGRPATGRVAIVDDAINAGTAVTATAAGIADLVAVGALLTLGEAPSRIADAPVLSLEPVPSGLWPTEACPLCAAGTPLT
jgi:orotate phosphoribosyltransferase